MLVSLIAAFCCCCCYRDRCCCCCKKLYKAFELPESIITENPVFNLPDPEVQFKLAAVKEQLAAERAELLLEQTRTKELLAEWSRLSGKLSGGNGQNKASNRKTVYNKPPPTADETAANRQTRFTPAAGAAGNGQPFSFINNHRTFPEDGDNGVGYKIMDNGRAVAGTSQPGSEIVRVSESEYLGAIAQGTPMLAGKHFWEWEVLAFGAEGEEEWSFGVCRPTARTNMSAKESSGNFQSDDNTWLCSQEGGNWAVNCSSCAGEGIASKFQKRLTVGDKVGLLLDLDIGGTLTVHLNGHAAGTIAEGLSGPLLPCICTFNAPASFRLESGLPVPVTAAEAAFAADVAAAADADKAAADKAAAGAARVLLVVKSGCAGVNGHYTIDQGTPVCEGAPSYKRGGGANGGGSSLYLHSAGYWLLNAAGGKYMNRTRSKTVPLTGWTSCSAEGVSPMATIRMIGADEAAEIAAAAAAAAAAKTAAEDSSSGESTTARSRKVSLVAEADRPLGFKLQPPANSSATVTIKKVDAGSEADKKGVHVGDAVTHINGTPLVGETMAAVGQLVASGGTVELTLASSDGNSSGSAGTSVVTVTKVAGTKLGLNIGPNSSGKPGIEITKVTPGSPAAGKLTVGDVIVEINGVDIKAGVTAAKPVIMKDATLAFTIIGNNKVGAVKATGGADRATAAVVRREADPADEAEAEPHQPKSRRKDIKLDRSGGKALGVKLMRNPASGAGVAVKSVDVGGQADGKLQSGDVLSHINGTDVVKAGMAQVKDLITSGDSCTFSVMVPEGAAEQPQQQAETEETEENSLPPQLAFASKLAGANASLEPGADADLGSALAVSGFDNSSNIDHRGMNGLYASVKPGVYNKRIEPYWSLWWSDAKSKWFFSRESSVGDAMSGVAEASAGAFTDSFPTIWLVSGAESSTSSSPKWTESTAIKIKETENTLVKSGFLIKSPPSGVGKGWWQLRALLRPSAPPALPNPFPHPPFTFLCRPNALVGHIDGGGSKHPLSGQHTVLQSCWLHADVRSIMTLYAVRLEEQVLLAVSWLG